MLAVVVTVAAMREMSTQGECRQRRGNGVKGPGGKQEKGKEAKMRERIQTTSPLREA